MGKKHASQYANFGWLLFVVVERHNTKYYSYLVVDILQTLNTSRLK